MVIANFMLYHSIIDFHLSFNVLNACCFDFELSLHLYIYLCDIFSV